MPPQVRPMFLKVLLSLTLPCAPLFPGTLDLLKPEFRERWVTLTAKPAEVVLSPVGKTSALRVSRADGALENTALLGYFDKDGLAVPGVPSHGGVKLAKVGDSVGVRAVISFNPGARYHIYNHAFRLALGNSGSTRVGAAMNSFYTPDFADDTGWVAAIGIDKSKPVFMRRDPSPKASVLGSLMGASIEKEWDRMVAKLVFQSGGKVEVIFNLTRNGPDSLRLYAFVQGVEQEHVAKGVTGFSFDTLCLLYPVAQTNKPAEMVIHELQIVTLP